jgi:hypothetical protein
MGTEGVLSSRSGKEGQLLSESSAPPRASAFRKSSGKLGDIHRNPPRLAVAIVLSTRDIAAAWGKATHVVAIFPTDAHAFTEGKDDKASKRS